MIDHVTYEVPMRYIMDDDLAEVFEVLGYYEVPHEETGIPPEWVVRWFRSRIDPFGPDVHLVASNAWRGDTTRLGLGHLCVRVNDYEAARKSRFCVRDSGENGRVWLVGLGGLRFEVRPS